MVSTHMCGTVIFTSVHKGFPSTYTQRCDMRSHASIFYNALVGIGRATKFIIMKRLSFLFVLLLSAVTVSAQYVDEKADVQKSYTVQQLVDTMNTLSMRDIIKMDSKIDEGRASWSRENLYAALKQLELKWIGRYDSVDVNVKIRNPKYPKKKVAKFLTKSLLDGTPEYIDSVYKKEVVMGGYKIVDPDSIEGSYVPMYGGGGLPLKYDASIFRKGTFRISDLNLVSNELSKLSENSSIYLSENSHEEEPRFTVTDEEGKKYEFDLGYITSFNPSSYITMSEKQKEDFLKGVKPAEEYTAWDCKSDFGEWYMSIYNNESLRPKLKEMQFISLMTGETVDGLQVEFKDINKTIGGREAIAKNAAFGAVVFPSNKTNGSLYEINEEWIPSVEIDFLNNQFVGREVIKPSPETITKIKRFIVTDKIPEKKSNWIKFYLAAEMENGDKVVIEALSIKEIQDLKVANRNVFTFNTDDWYDYKIYNETVLIPAKQRAEEWEKQKAIRAKQRAANLPRYTQKYGEKIAKAIVDGRVIPGMTVNIITDEMGLSYEIVNSSTIIVGPAIGGIMVFKLYKCAVANGKITLVENIFMKE